jgi:hypothetical protein
VQEVWKKLGIFDKIENAMTVDRAESAVLEELIIQVLRDLVLTSTWYIWWMRCQFVHKEKTPTTIHTTLSIQTIATNNRRVMVKNAEKRKGVWAKPKEGYVLINVDASYDPESHSGGIVAVLRDDVGRFIAACNDLIIYGEVYRGLQ